MKTSGHNGNGGGKPAPWWEQVPPIVPGQEIYSAAQFRMLLGGISESYYHELRDKGLFKFSRMGKGRKVVHTRQQYLEYVAYLNGDGEVKVSAGYSGPRSIDNVA